MQPRRRALKERGLIGGRPHVLTPRAAIKATAARAWIGEHKPTIECPRQDASENIPRVIRLPAPRTCGELVAPCHENSARAAIGQRREREVAELFFNALD